MGHFQIKSILGIESTCDETAAAVVRDGREILSNVVASQATLHEPFGGVVPELASRQHLQLIGPVIREALVDEVDAVAVAQGPGLLGALLVGINAAKGFAIVTGKPLIAVNHVEAHLYATMMQQEVPLPALGVVISGGHTALLKVHAVGEYELLGSTVDDAIGESFDKVASMLGLPYPGGPAVEQLAREGDEERFAFRAGRVKGRPLAFSFSGLKTSVLYKLRETDAHADVAASFQKAALQDVVNKSLLASEGCRAILLGGGVCQNRRLKELYQESPLPVFWPPPELTLDNAAMIAGLAFHKEPEGDLSLKPMPRMPLLQKRS